jgi:transcriptional regulator with XRE-family HTH domain
LNLDKLGERLRHIRRIKKFRLSDVARLVPCSESMLSKIETGRIIPSLHLLQRITMVLDITTAELVDNSNESAVLIYKKGTRTNIQLGDSGNHGLILQRLIPFSRGRILNANIHIISPGSGNGGELKHVGEEIGFVLEGQIELTVGNEVYVLNAEDSFFFESHIPHRYRNIGKTVARVLWVNSPIV